MRILTTNMCSECCYCIEDYDNDAFCNKDMIYKPIKLNQSACKYFCDDSNQFNNYNYNNNELYDEENQEQYYE